MYDQATHRRTVRITQLAGDLASAYQRLDDARSAEAGAGAEANIESIGTRIRNIAVKLGTSPLDRLSSELSRLGYDYAADVLVEELDARSAYLDLYPQEAGR